MDRVVQNIGLPPGGRSRRRASGSIEAYFESFCRARFVSISLPGCSVNHTVYRCKTGSQAVRQCSVWDFLPSFLPPFLPLTHSPQVLTSLLHHHENAASDSESEKCSKSRDIYLIVSSARALQLQPQRLRGFSLRRARLGEFREGIAYARPGPSTFEAALLARSSEAQCARAG